MADRRKKINAGQVTEIRAKQAKGATLIELANKYRVSINYIWKIVHGTAPKGSSPLVCPHCHGIIS